MWYVTGGAKVYVYAMAPFLSVRCYEQHKTATCLMNTQMYAQLLQVLD